MTQYCPISTCHLSELTRFTVQTTFICSLLPGLSVENSSDNNQKLKPGDHGDKETGQVTSQFPRNNDYNSSKEGGGREKISKLNCPSELSELLHVLHLN